MKLMVGIHGGVKSVFLVDGNQAKNLSDANSAIGSDLMNIVQGDVAMADIASLADGAETVDVSTVLPALPIETPSKVVCLGLNYLDHIKEGGRDIPEYPVFFLRTITSLIAAEAPIIKPDCSDTLDYEGELLAIIGKGGKHITEEDALSHVFGYTVFNDGSVREYQRKSHQWTAGKNFDATGPIGPVVVTSDELPSGGDGLKIETRINGEVFQSASTSDMMYSTAQTIAALSEWTTLQPGDLIATGTPPGVGFARKPPRWLVPGDVVEVEIEGIGICRNPVVAEQ